MFFWISSAKASVRKAPTTPYLQCFFPTKDKTGLFTMISHPRSRKIEPTHWLQQRKSQRSKFANVSYNAFAPPLQKQWYLQCFEKTHAYNTANTNVFKITVSMAASQNKQKH